jgi:hypothetical protein
MAQMGYAGPTHIGFIFNNLRYKNSFTTLAELCIIALEIANAANITTQYPILTSVFRADFFAGSDDNNLSRMSGP